MNPGIESLEVVRVNRIMQMLEDKRNLPQELEFVKRIPMVPAGDGDILGRWINRVQIADLISDDGKANVYSAGKLQLEQTTIPNLKHGRLLSQETINQLAAINMLPMPTPIGPMPNNEVFGDIMIPIVDNLRTGIYQRMETLLVMMHLDSLSYNRLNIQITTNPGQISPWGIPNDLKVVPAIPWTNAGSATPVNDIWNLKREASVRYGATYDRMWMSTTAFNLMISTTNYQNMARTTVPLAINFNAFPLANIPLQKDIATNVLGLKEIKLYDARYWSQDQTGNITSAPYLPINKVILDSIQNDNNPQVQDFANGITTESRDVQLPAQFRDRNDRQVRGRHSGSDRLYQRGTGDEPPQPHGVGRGARLPATVPPVR